MRAGDFVKHIPTGETWVVAYVDGNYLAWNGWPEGEARVDDCELLEACSDADHERALHLWADEVQRRDGGGIDRRHVVCKRQLEEWLRSKP